MSSHQLSKFAVAATLALAAPAFAADVGPDVDGLEAYALPTYTIVTHDEGNARPIPRLVEQIDGVLAKLLNRGPPVPSTPTYIFLVRDDDWQRYLQPGPGISGEFVAGRFANYIVMSNARDLSEVGPGVFHEYTHWFLHTQFGGDQPLWFDEGMASFVSSAQFRGATVVLGEPDEQRNQLGWVPLKQLLSMTKRSPEYRNEASTEVIHRQSWTIVHRGLAGDPEFGKQMFAFLAAQHAQQPIEAAVQASFGMSLEKLNTELYAYQKSSGLYLTSSSFKVLKLQVEPARAMNLPPGRAMSKAESLDLFAELMLAFGFHNDRLGEVADAMARANPDSFGAVVLRLRAAALARDDANFERIYRMIEPQTVDSRLGRGVGLAAFDRWHLAAGGNPLTPAQRERLTTRAFDLLDRAIMSRPDDAEAVWAYALLSASLKRDVPNATRRLRAVMAIWPADPDLKDAMARLREAGAA